jgi:hypothetical protein
MRKVSEYQEHAEECRKMARQTTNKQHKKQLEDMAQAWDMLVKGREKQVSKEQK